MCRTLFVLAVAVVVAAVVAVGREEDAIDLLMAGPVWRLFFDVMTG